MASVVRTIPDAVCFIAGRGELDTELRQAAVELGIDRNLRLLGFRPDVPALLRAADVFVLPSLSEGLSLALLEAMAASKPVVASKVGGNPEVVADGRNGFLVPAADPDALADRIVRLLGNADLAARFGAAGRRRVDEDFTIATMVRRYDELYRDCLSN